MFQIQFFSLSCGRLRLSAKAIVPVLSTAVLTNGIVVFIPTSLLAADSFLVIPEFACTTDVDPVDFEPNDALISYLSIE